MCQLPDPPSEPLQTSRCNDGATLPTTMGQPFYLDACHRVTYTVEPLGGYNMLCSSSCSFPYHIPLLSLSGLLSHAHAACRCQTGQTIHTQSTQSPHNPQLQTVLQCRVARLFTQALCSMFCMCLPLLLLLLLLFLLLYMPFVAPLYPPPSLPTRLLGFFLPGMLMTLAA